MPDTSYFGRYARFDTLSKKDAAALINADSIVGDLFDVEIVHENGQRRAWIKNKFGTRVGFLDAEMSHKLSVSEARGWKNVALLSFVAFSEKPEPGVYWGEAAVISYDPKDKDIFEPFLQRIGKLMASGLRPQIDLGTSAIKQLRENPNSWMPNERVPLPSKERGTAILKSRQSVSEKLIEQGRRKNIGCYIIGWGFILALATLIVIVGRSLLNL